MTSLKETGDRILNAFAAAKNGKSVQIDDKGDPEFVCDMVCDLAFFQGLRIIGKQYWPGPEGGWEDCKVDQNNPPEAIEVSGETITFMYF